MPNLATHLGDFHFANPLMNASGVYCYDQIQLDAMADSAAGTLTTKSATMAARLGNPEPRYAHLELGSINSMGLPNLGLPYYLDYALDFQNNHPTKPIFMSIAGLSHADNVAMAQMINDSEFNGLTELNLSCPNVPGKPQVAYDLDATAALLDDIFSFFTKPMGVKLPPYFDLAQFDEMAAILNRYPLVYVNSINSLGNGLWVNPDSDTVAIKPKGGFGGIGGDYAKPIALANVRAFAQRLKPEIQIIGTGGVKTGRDVYDLLLCGASLVQVGTALYEEGPDIFARLNAELDEELTKKGLTDLDAVIGQLKTLD